MDHGRRQQLLVGHHRRHYSQRAGKFGGHHLDHKWKCHCGRKFIHNQQCCCWNDHTGGIKHTTSIYVDGYIRNKYGNHIPSFGTNQSRSKYIYHTVHSASGHKHHCEHRGRMQPRQYSNHVQSCSTTARSGLDQQKLHQLQHSTAGQ